MKSLLCSKSFLAIWFCGALALTGCEEKVEFGQVSGTVTIDGQPLDGVLVMFLPEPVEGKKAVHSESVTDADGKYSLVYSADAEQKGAVVGMHRVVVEDIAAENTRDQNVQIRVNDAYASSAQTPLKFDVKPGEQTIDIPVEGR